MPVDVVVPQVGEAVSAVTISRWLKHVGDEVKEGEPLFEVDTEKANIEIEAAVSGQLVEILTAEGSEAQPMQVVARILTAGESVPEPSPSARSVTQTPTAASYMSPPPPTPVIVHGQRVRATPLAKSLARELGVDLTKAVATGPAGMVCAADVRRTAAQLAKRPPVAAPLVADEGQLLTGARAAIARSMTQSKATIPHFYVMRDVEMGQAARLRDYLGDAWGEKPTYTVLLVKACALALRDFPNLNVNLRGERLYRRPTIDIGVAVAVPPSQGEPDGGLVVPVVRVADGKNLKDIAQELGELVERARSNRLRLDDVDASGRSLTLSNLGMYRADAFVPIIYLPDPMLVAAGAVAERPWVERGQLVVRPVLTLTVAADHRVMDGVAGARYIDRVRELLEYPYIL